MDKLDSDLLRTFLAVAETGSVTAGASLIHRSQSAASLQIKQLEGLLGQRVFARHGRGVTLSAAGERLLPVARRVTHALDAALADIRSDGLSGRLRIGLPDDRSRDMLSKIVADFARDHPRVELAVQCALSAGFQKSLDAGALDLAVHEVATLRPDMELLREDTMHWVTSKARGAENREPLPVALFDRDCWWRDAALAALEASGRSYRIVYSSESVTGVLAAVEAGIAVGLLSSPALHAGLATVPGLMDAMELPTSKLVLQRGRYADATVTRAMCSAIRRAFVAHT